MNVSDFRRAWICRYKLRKYKKKIPLRGLRVCLRKTILASLRVYCDSRDILCLQCFPLRGSNQLGNYSKCQYVINRMHQLTRLI